MSTGDFHGGDTHIGDFHDSGGGFFGGGDGFGGGGDSFFPGLGGGDYYDTPSDLGASDSKYGKLVAIIPWAVMGTFILVFFTIEFFFETLPGVNIYNLLLFCAGYVLLGISMKDYGRTSALMSIRRGKLPKYTGEVRNGRYVSGALCDGRSWAVENNKHYLISVFDSDFGTDNAEKLYDTMKRTPGILWMNLFVWPAAGIFFTLSHVFFYELIIPIFEKRIMTDQAFAFVDALTFYLPSILVLLSGAACFIIVRIRDSIISKCAIRIVKDNLAAEEKREAEDFIAAQLGKKWYYNTCPNCGAEAKETQSACTVCGSSLEVPSSGNINTGAVHRLSSGKVTGISDDLTDEGSN